MQIISLNLDSVNILLTFIYSTSIFFNAIKYSSILRELIRIIGANISLKLTLYTWVKPLTISRALKRSIISIMRYFISNTHRLKTILILIGFLTISHVPLVYSVFSSSSTASLHQEPKIGLLTTVLQLIGIGIRLVIALEQLLSRLITFISKANAVINRVSFIFRAS